MPTQQTAPPPRERLDEIRAAIVTPMAALAAMELGIFTALAEGAQSAESLAEKLDVRPRRLSMLLHQLVVSEFLSLEEGQFSNSPIAAHYLSEASADYIGEIHGLWREQFVSLLQTSDSIRSDEPKAKIDFLGMPGDELATFLKGLHGMTVAAGRNMAAKPEFSDATTVIDIGCGSGGIAIACCLAHPNLTATATDLPTVIPVANEMIAEAGLTDRITTATVDIVNQTPPDNFDIATARSLFQVLSREQCKKAAKNIAAALRPGGTLFIIGHVLDDTRLTPVNSVGLNLAFLNVFDDGESYTESEYFGWLDEAGFEKMTREPLFAGTSLIVARKGEI